MNVSEKKTDKTLSEIDDKIKEDSDDDLKENAFLKKSKEINSTNDNSDGFEQDVFNEFINGFTAQRSPALIRGIRGGSIHLIRVENIQVDNNNNNQWRNGFVKMPWFARPDLERDPANYFAEGNPQIYNIEMLLLNNIWVMTARGTDIDQQNNINVSGNYSISKIIKTTNDSWYNLIYHNTNNNIIRYITKDRNEQFIEPTQNLRRRRSKFRFEIRDGINGNFWMYPFPVGDFVGNGYLVGGIQENNDIVMATTDQTPTPLWYFELDNQLVAVDVITIKMKLILGQNIYWVDIDSFETGNRIKLITTEPIYTSTKYLELKLSDN